MSSDLSDFLLLVMEQLSLWSGLAFGIMSVIGFVGLSVGPALFARLLKRSYPPQPASTDSRISFLIPVHNQAEALAASLANLQQEAPEALVMVGANACSDQSADVARQASLARIKPIHLIERVEPGKWTMLRDLLQQADTEWICFLDAGSILPAHFLENLHLSEIPGDVMGIAPSYRPSKVGRLQNWNWQFEAFLKNLENSCGGPISVHGACVIYRRTRAVEAFKALQENIFLNDDVALPLQLRWMFPAERLLYRRDLHIDDRGLDAPSSPSARRQRMVRGNIQWIHYFCPRIWSNNRTLELLVSRRIFRLAWAWWISFGMASFLSLMLFFLFSSLRTQHLFNATSTLEKIPKTEPLWLSIGLGILFLVAGLGIFSLKKRHTLASFWASIFFYREIFETSSVKLRQIKTSPWR